jgi:hypothetical protein
VIARRAVPSAEDPDADAPAGHRCQPEERAQETCPPGADQAGDAEDLAAMQGERRAARLDRAHLEQRLSRLPCLSREEIRRRRSDHQRDNGAGRRVGCRTAADVAPVAQDNEALGDRLHLLDEV